MISSQHISQRERRTHDTPSIVIDDNLVLPEIVIVVGFCDGVSDGIELGTSDKMGVGFELKDGN